VLIFKKEVRMPKKREIKIELTGKLHIPDVAFELLA